MVAVPPDPIGPLDRTNDTENTPFQADDHNLFQQMIDALIDFLTSDGVLTPNPHPIMFSLHTRSIAIPTGVWTPVPQNFNEGNVGAMHDLNTSSTTVSSTMNGLPLPMSRSISGAVTATSPDRVVAYAGSFFPADVGSVITGPGIPVNTTIASYVSSAQVTVSNTPTPQSGITVVVSRTTFDVASTSGFDSSGYFTVTGPPGAGVDTILQYTGTTSGSFTGVTRGTGTLATGQIVRPANEGATTAVRGIYECVAQVAWAAHPTGRRGVRIVSGLPVGCQEVPSTNTASQNVAVGGQPLIAVGGDCHIEAFQSSGGVLYLVQEGIQAPTMGLTYSCPFP